MTSFPTLNHHAKLMLSTKDWAGLPSSFDGWRPKRTLFCRQLLGIRKPDFICPSCSFNAVFDKQTLRCRRIWSSFRVRHKPHRKRAAVISNSVWEGDWTSQTDHHQAQEDSQLFRIGPLPGDLAEVEAFCRIFRVAEQLHTAIMENLCNPDTGECTVTYQPESPNSVCGDVSLLEERVVAGLACIATLLHRARQEVIAGRSASVSSFQVRDSNVVDDKLPPLALFRAEMKKCCENLQSALECYFPLTDEQSTDIWRRLQRLKNICYDAGFPRSEGSPCYTVLPNWAAVSLRTGRGGRMSDNDEVAFWRGGQVTEEGLKWLLDKGYKIIVDLRAERVKDQQSLDAIEKAVSSGKIQVVHFPVQIGAAPTKAQVEEFAALVLNYQSSPLYLHSQEGVWRTSAMVSRWRELISRSSSHHGSSSMFKVNGILPKDVLNHKKDDTNSKRLVRSPDLQVLKTEDSVRSLNLGIGSLLEVPDRNHSLRETVQTECPQLSDFTTGKHNSQTVGHVLDVNEGKNSKRERDENQAGLHHQESFWTNNPFEAQRPTCNVLSKREMSEFMKNRKIAPKTYCESGRKRSKISSVSSNSDTSESIQNGEIAGAAGRWGLAQPGILTATSSCKDLVSVSACVKSMEEHVRNVENSVSFDVDRNSTDECIDETNSCSEAKSENCSSGDEGFSGGSGSSSKKEVQNGSFVRLSLASPADDNDDLEPVNGNMCASTTGVVRVQSRKKAEMYLVRTDGFTCARERVKESSLAFTHPSTQQQMLMWKTPPKTVLLLKKLGNELMEEAKQVASFLYHQERMNVVVEPDVHDTFARIPGFGFVQTFYNQDTSDLHERVDFVACLGGDGVILHASNLFREAVPPVVSFSLGSLGFLTAHPFTGFKPDLRAIIHGNTRTDGVYITLRMRLRCEIFRNGKAMPGKVFDVLNEVVVDRGSNPYLCKIECYEHNRLITKVQADGVIVATPTGSTAYSTAAGGSMVHPNVPCMLFTPICPHSLSFRPVILPDSAQLELKIPDDARSNAWVSFDGKRRQQLSKGDSVRVCMSEHPLPTVNKSDQTGDWFRSLVRCLNWNERLEQKALIG